MHYLDNRVFIDGKATPSANPKKARMTKRLVVEWFAAHGVSRVAKDHNAAPQEITFLPPYLSTKAPPITDEKMYPQRNDDYWKGRKQKHIISTLDDQICKWRFLNSPK